MVIYWRFQFYIDATLVAALSYVLLKGSFSAIFFVEVNPSEVTAAARMWVGPILTLLGMVCATTAFLFSAIDRSEFELLRSVGVESQLWAVFSELIFWLAVAAVSAAAFSFVDPVIFPPILSGYAFFLFLIVCLCLFKFAWVMRQIIAVRAK